VASRDGIGRRVLVVDDEPQVRATVTEALELEGYVVTQATNGAEALVILASQSPDVIVLDLWMPVMDGWAFRRAQLATYPHIPVVVLSALDLSSERLQELRANALIGKPFDLDVLYGAVYDVLPKRS
jgi:two-component system response regulator MprA